MSLSPSENALRLAKLGALLDKTEFTPDEVMEVFASTIYDLPENAMRWSLANWGQVVPVFIQWLEDKGEPPEEDERYENTGLFIIMLCAQIQEGAAFEPLCRLLRNGRAIENVLGNASTELLGSLLLATCTDNLAGLQAVVTDLQAAPFHRAAALGVMACLAAEGSIPRESLREALLMTVESLEEENYFTFRWTQASVCLGDADLVAKSKEMYNRYMIETICSIEEFEADIIKLGSNPSPLAVAKLFEFEYIGNVIEQLAEWPEFNGTLEQEDRDLRDDEWLQRPPESYFDRSWSEPVLNPHKNVGRNDPCPCGSGKKFKKCCAD